MIEIVIRDAEGHPLDAKIEFGSSEIIVHSRSGGGAKARNPQYRRALETILGRLQREAIKPSIYLDSAPAQKARRLADRLLARPADLSGDVAAQFDYVIRKSNEGSQSNGAYRRLLLRVSRMPDYALRSILDGSAQSRHSHLPTSDLRRVTARHLDAAIAEVRFGERPNRFEEATKYHLIPKDGGTPLPPKKVFGIALAEALQTHITPSDFSSGEGIFSIIREAGFDVEKFVEGPSHNGPPRRRPAPTPSEVERAIHGMPVTPEERSWIEGNLQVAVHLRKERSSSLPKQFRTDFRAKHGKLYCQRCTNDYIDDFGPEFAEACFEVHHILQVSQMPEEHQTKPEHLELLCANCHRITHKKLSQS